MNTRKASAIPHSNTHLEPNPEPKPDGKSGRSTAACADSPCQEWASVVNAAINLIDQCEQFVKEVPAPVYATESMVMPGGTVGKHLRHLVDHYEAIVRAAASACEEVVDYDHRERDVPMESSRDEALRGIDALRTNVRQLVDHQATRPVRVRVMVSSAGHEATLTSSLARELAFATHHGVHHQAMMKTIAGEFGVEASPDFGKAPSTLNHEVAKR